MHARRVISLFLLLSWLNPVFGAGTEWHAFSSGVEYTRIPLSSVPSYGQLHAFRIDLNHYQLESLLAKEIQKPAYSVEEAAKTSDALIAINGGFFTPDYQPLGLRISSHKVRNPFKNTRWWGIFLIDDHGPQVISAEKYSPNDRVSFAIQAGPRLLINGQIPALKAGYAERSALCITADKKVIILATENASISTRTLAELIKRAEQEHGLGCVNALNLDGGTSSQLYAQIGEFWLNIPNYRAVSDVIIVKPIS
jgi:uncharacterized protein YigE (DUF2233 family)